MLIQTNVANSLEGHNGLTVEWEASVRSRLARYEDRLTRIEIHVGDVNANKGGPDDKRCTLEARPNGLDPVSVTDDAATIDQAVAGAAGKLLVTLERTFGKLTNRKGH